MSAFDPTTFLNTATTGAMDTSLPMIPAGEYNAYIDKLDMKSFPIQRGERAGQMLHKLELMCKLMAPGADADGRTVRHDVILDVTDTGLDTSKGKNIGLGQVREAVGLNDPSASFAPNMLVGRQLRVLVEHEPDRNDPNKFYSRVKRVAAVQ